MQTHIKSKFAQCFLWALFSEMQITVLFTWHKLVTKFKGNLHPGI